MLYAQGNISLPPLVHAMQQMALDQTSIHEHNQHQGRGSFLHPDGWGMAYQKNQAWVIEKSINPIYQESSYLITSLANVKTLRLLLHVRKTSGTDVCLENTHPFYYNHSQFGELIFCHNGTIKNKISFDRTQFTPQGTTDTEQLFYAILTHAQTMPLKQALILALAKLTKIDAANIILITKDATYIALGPHTYTNYFTMALGTNTQTLDENSLIVSSEQLSSPEFAHITWQPLVQNTLLTITSTQEYTLESLPSLAQSIETK